MALRPSAHGHALADGERLAVKCLSRVPDVRWG